MTQKLIHHAISSLLVAKLQQYQGKNIDQSICIEIYTEIFKSLVELFEQMNTKLSNEAVNYLAQQYYDGVLINNTQELDPNIFTVRANLDNIETKEIIILVTFLRGTDFIYPLLAKIKQRS